jgi:Tfp pilus assembly protein PilX
MVNHHLISDTRNGSHSESGFVLVITVLVALVLLGGGLTAMWMASGQTKVGGHILRRQEALKAAEVGIERARAILTNMTDWNTILGDSGGVSCTSTPYSSTKGNVLCDGVTPLENVQVMKLGTSTLTALPETANLRYTVYVRNDPVEIAVDPTNNTFTDHDQQLVLISQGWAKDGLSSTAIEVWLKLSN